jgi:hypothetical protein
MPASGIPGLRDGGISKTPSKRQKFHTIASSTPSKTPSRSRDVSARTADANTPGKPAQLFQMFSGFSDGKVI